MEITDNIDDFKYNIRNLLISYHESQMPKTITSHSIYIEKCVDDFLNNL